jgi:ribosome biogenesis GTPase A
MSINNIEHSLAAFTADLRPVHELEEKTLQLRDGLLNRLQQTQLNLAIKKSHPLHVINTEIQQSLQKIVGTAATQWEQNQAMRELSNRYQDRTLLLVCGKVNSGKSSLINFLTTQFAHLPLRFFHLQAGKVQPLHGHFRVDCVEATSAIQWVEIGDRLVIMDSPGLHSVTPENAALARQFVDTADGILWVTSSRSAAQVQELDVLNAELQTRKPLLPVLTQSDSVEQDEDDQGNVFDLLVAKSAVNRRTLEEDVYKRAHDYFTKNGAEAKLRMPVSISVKYQRTFASQPDTLAVSGIGDLFHQIAWLINQARSYKPNKARQQMTNYLQQQLLHPICVSLNSSMVKLQFILNEELVDLQQAKSTVSCQVRAHMLELAPGLVEKHRDTQNLQGLQKDLNEQIASAIAAEVDVHLSRCLESLGNALVEISSIGLQEFSPITAQVRQLSGSVQAACVSAGFAVAGLALGSLAGPLAAVAGSAVGGLVGRAVGNTLIKETWVTTHTGEVDASGVLRSAMKGIERLVPEQVNRVIDEIINTLNVSDRYLVDIQQAVTEFESDLAKLFDPELPSPA